MEDLVLKTNLLSIIVCGLVMALMGIGLYHFKDTAAPYMRFWLPVPPIAVASYIYVFNMFKKFEGGLPKPMLLVFGDILMATVFSTVIFLVFTLLLIFLIDCINRTT